MTDKRRLRDQARARLALIPSDERLRLAERIEASVWSIPEIRMAGTLLLYASVGTEVPTDSIAMEARLRGIRVVYPRCPPDSPAMTLHTVHADDLLLAGGRFGIREPAPDCPATVPAEIDAAFLPGLGWDRSGGRLGRGAGYYDRLLADPAWRAFRCGLFFAVQEIPEIPTDPWDRPLDAAVTEKGVIRF
jgi:5-formyltetrahydrofolate cyclo-ligase